MPQKMQKLEWHCQVCGVSGTREMWAVLSDYGKVAQLVLSHSLQSPGCSANARASLRYRDVTYSGDATMAGNTEERDGSVSTAVKRLTKTLKKLSQRH